MRKALLTLLALLVPAAAFAGADKPGVRTLDARFACAGVELVELEFPVGEVHIAAHDGRDLLVKVELACETRRSRSCQEAAQAVRLVGKVDDERLHVELTNWPRVGARGMEARAKVQVPRFLALRCDLGVGELKISGMERDVAVDIGVGEVHVSMPEHAVGSVDLDVGVGEADLSTTRGRQAGKGFIAKELHWRKGKGEAAVKVDCGVGEINVALVGSKPPL